MHFMVLRSSVSGWYSEAVPYVHKVYFTASLYFSFLDWHLTRLTYVTYCTATFHVTHCCDQSSKRREDVSGWCVSNFKVTRHSTFCLLSLHLPVYGRVHDHASVDHPGIYHRSILRYGYRPVSESRPVSLVTPSSILCGDALMALLAILYAHVWHTVPLMSLLCENAILGISVSLGHVLSKLECVVSSSCYCLHV